MNIGLSFLSPLNMLFFPIVLLSIFSIQAHASKRSLPSGVVTCGDNRYTVSAITAAIDAGVRDMDEGNFPGKSAVCSHKKRDTY